MSLPTNSNNGNFYGEQPNQGGYSQDGTPAQGYNPNPETPTKGKKIALITGASVLVVGLLAGGAYAVTNGVNAIGDKDIAKALPGTSAIYGEIDLDPSNEQKLGLVSLAQKVKDISKEEDINPEKDPKEMITDGFFEDLDFETEVKPWIGDKVAVAAWGDFSQAAKDYRGKPTMKDSYSDEALLNEYSELENMESYDSKYSEGYTDNDVPVENSNFDEEFVAERAASTTAVAPDHQKKSDSIHNVIVYEVKDEKKAKEAADKAFADKDEKFLVQDGYLIIGENQEDIDAYGDAIKNGTLADQETFKEDRKTFNKDAIATGWADLGKFDLGSSAKNYYGALETKDGKPFTLEGRVITGLSLEQGKASSTTKVIAVKSNAYDVTSSTEADGVKDIGNLPGNSFGALAISGLDQSVKDAWEQNAEEIESSDSFASTKADLEEQYGITLPEDFTKLLGTETVIGVGEAANKEGSSKRGSSRSEYGGHLRLTDADTVLFEKFLTDSGADNTVTVSDEDGVTVLNYNGDDNGDKLKDSETFKKAVGNFGDSQIVAFADIDKIAEVSGEESKGYGVVGLNGVFDKDDNVSTVTVNWIY